ncbi:MAG: PAS domain S-box protein [Candidatus Kapabacteria bacterium]|nr:PAS domain S-box protein [Candidatus Kapabacteria bacterium]
MEKILIVDDREENISFLNPVFKDLGYGIICANNGASALALARKNPPLMIISDIQMPEMDGFALCREWQKDETLKHIPFIFYSSIFVERKDEEFALSLGALKFISKTTDLEEFITIIKDTVQNYKADESIRSAYKLIDEIEYYKNYSGTLKSKLDDNMAVSDINQRLIDEIKEHKKLEAELKHSQDELKNSALRFQTLFEKANDGIMQLTLDGRIIAVNESFAKMHGYSSEEMEHLTTLDLNTPESALGIPDRIARHLAGELMHFEVEHFHKDGHCFPLEVTSSLINIGDETFILSYHRDITERKKAEDAIKESNERFRQISETAEEWIWEVDADGLYTYASAVVEKVLGYSPEEIVGKKYFYDFFPEEIKETYKNAAFKAFERKDSFKSFVNENIHKDGHNVFLETNGLPILDKDGNLRGYRGADVNITERKKFEVELQIAKAKAEESDRLKTAFLQNMSHEIRTPLNGIIGFSELLRSDDLTVADIQEYSGLIQQSGHRLIEIVNNILDISKIETGQLKIQHKTFSLNNLVKDIYNFFIPIANAKNIKLNYQISADIIVDSIITDNTKLNQILTNLINNALKFTEKGRVDFGYEIKDNFIEFYVRDTGIGIAKELHHKIFERFIQGDISVSRGYEGAGLGLAICEALVEMLGGKIWLESEINRGATFYFNIPLITDDKIEANQTKKQIRSLNQSQLKILIVDDDHTSYLYMRSVLKKNNYFVLYADNGKLCLEILKENPDIALILMDIKMPIMDGFTATKEIKLFRPDIPIIAQTAYAFTEEKKNILTAGCDDYISKPYEKAVLLNLIEKYLQ